MFRVHRVWSILQPQRPRHPLVSALLGLFAICAMLAVLAIGAVVGLIVFIVSALWRLFQPAVATAPRSAREQPTHADDGHVIDGEFSVLRKPLPHIPPR